MMDNYEKPTDEQEVESLMGILELINAKGDQEEIEGILNREDNNVKKPSRL